MLTERVQYFRRISAILPCISFWFESKSRDELTFFGMFFFSFCLMDEIHELWFQQQQKQKIGRKWKKKLNGLQTV